MNSKDFKVNIKVCRVCMNSEEGHSLLKDLELQSKFVFTTRLSLTPGDSMPVLICAKCTVRLKGAYDFVQLAHVSHKNLKAFLAKISNDFNEVTKISSSTKSSPLREDEVLTIFDDNTDENFSQEAHEFVPNASKRDVTKDKKVTVQQPKPVAISASATALKFQEQPIIPVKETKSSTEQTAEVPTEEGDDNFDGEIVFYEEGNFLEEESDFEDIEQKTVSTVNEVDSQVDETTPLSNKCDADTRFYGYLQEYNTMLSEPNDNSNEAVATQYIYDNSGDDEEDEETAVPVEELHIFEESNTDMVQEHVNDSEIIAIDETSEIYDEKVVLPIEDENADSSRAESYQPVELKLDESLVLKLKKEIQPQNKPLRPAHKPKKAATKSTSINARFFCVKCNRDFSTKTNLTRHMVTHEGVRPYQCLVCDKSFSQNGSLKQHMMTHTGEKPYVCEVCNRGFSQCKSLVFHMRRHTGEKPFPCEHCGMFFRQRDGLKTHILKHHMIRQTNGETVTHTCIICKQLLSTKAALHKHMKKHMNSHTTINYQSSGTVAKENILMEMTDDDLTNEKSFISEELALNIEDLSSSTQIIDAMTANTVKASRVKKFQCRKCYKCFAIKKNLLRHLTTHDVSVSELFQCSTCQVAFDTNYALRVHRVREHKETSINLNECENCNLTFSNANELSDHNNAVHEIVEQKCPECPDLLFKTQKHLVHHMLEHENLLNEVDDD